MAAPPKLFDRRLRRLRLERAARSGGGDFLHRRAAEDAAGRLTDLARRLDSVLELGSWPGLLAAPLAETEPAMRGRVVEAAPRARSASGAPRVVVDEDRLPFRAESFDAVASPLALHWADDLVGALIQIRRILRPGGLFVGALFGRATLAELREALVAAELELLGGAFARVSPFLDAYDGAALLQRAGFADPVADTETLSVTYPDAAALLRDLRRMGETNLLRDRAPPLRRQALERLSEIYRARSPAAGGRVRATFEIVTLTGWAPPGRRTAPSPADGAERAPGPGA